MQKCSKFWCKLHTSWDCARYSGWTVHKFVQITKDKSKFTLFSVQTPLCCYASSYEYPFTFGQASLVVDLSNVYFSNLVDHQEGHNGFFDDDSSTHCSFSQSNLSGKEIIKRGYLVFGRGIYGADELFHPYAWVFPLERTNWTTGARTALALNFSKLWEEITGSLKYWSA